MDWTSEAESPLLRRTLRRLGHGQCTMATKNAAAVPMPSSSLRYSAIEIIVHCHRSVIGKAGNRYGKGDGKVCTWFAVGFCANWLWSRVAAVLFFDPLHLLAAFFTPRSESCCLLPALEYEDADSDNKTPYQYLKIICLIEARNNNIIGSNLRQTTKYNNASQTKTQYRRQQQPIANMSQKKGYAL